MEQTKLDLATYMSHVLSHPSVTVMWPSWAFEKPYNRHSSVRFVLRVPSDGITQAAAHFSSIAKK